MGVASGPGNFSWEVGNYAFMPGSIKIGTIEGGKLKGFPEFH